MKLQLLLLIGFALFRLTEGYCQKTNFFSTLDLDTRATFINKEMKTIRPDLPPNEYNRLIPVVFIHPNEKGDKWVYELIENRGISCDTGNILYRMLEEAGENKNVFLTVFLDNESEYHFREVLGYTENGKDVFMDSHFRKYNSLKELLKKRYGSVKRYKEIYKIYNTLLNYGTRAPKSARTRIISQTDIRKEIKNNVKNKFVIIAINAKEENPYKYSGALSYYILYYYNKKYIILHDFYRFESKIVKLKNIKDFFFYAINFHDYNGGNCNE